MAVPTGVPGGEKKKVVGSELFGARLMLLLVSVDVVMLVGAVLPWYV